MNKIVNKLHEMGIEVIDEHGNFRTLLDVLNEISSKYNEIYSNKPYTNKYKECLKKATKEDLLNIEKLLADDGI